MDKCDECGVAIPINADSVMGAYHLDSCSAYLPKKECKGKAAARLLATIVLNGYLVGNAPKAHEQACRALEPFGYPDIGLLKAKLGI